MKSENESCHFAIFVVTAETSQCVGWYVSTDKGTVFWLNELNLPSEVKSIKHGDAKSVLPSHATTSP